MAAAETRGVQSSSDGGPGSSESSPHSKRMPTGTLKTDVGNSAFYSKPPDSSCMVEGPRWQSQMGIVPIFDSLDRHEIKSMSASVRVKAMAKKHDFTSRFPKLEDCAHFHYDYVELSLPLQISIITEENLSKPDTGQEPIYYIKVQSNEKTWTIKRSYENFRLLDKQLHKCIYDRSYSELIEIESMAYTNEESTQGKLQHYLDRLSAIAGNMINCGPILNWLEMDNRGNRLIITGDDSDINTPAIAAAHVVKKYIAQASDEISLEVGDMVSVIDMPPAEDTVWWRGKKGFEVGFFKAECVEVISDKVPQAVESRLPQKPVLRRRGKLISFLRTFFNHRPARSTLKQTGIVKERVFGCDLGEHLLNSGSEVPLVLTACAEVIENHGIVDGIYRLSGVASNIQKLRLSFDEGQIPDLTCEHTVKDIHSISSLLKMYFRELPNPLFTYQLYSKFSNAVQSDDEDVKWNKIRDVVLQLPPPHYRTAEFLMRHLNTVATFGRDTGMHCKNLAIVWAPNLLRSKELEAGGGAAALQGVGVQAIVTEFLIKFADSIFSKGTDQKGQLSRPKSLVLNTPTKLLSLEEAQKVLSSVVPEQKYIEVGGGPSALPEKYHTVIDLPGRKSRGKKSPGTFKSIFSKGKGSGKMKQRKGSAPGEMPLRFSKKEDLQPGTTQSLERRKLRPVKSADSLSLQGATGATCIVNPYAEDETEFIDRPQSVDDSFVDSSHPPTKIQRSNSLESYFEQNLDTEEDKENLEAKPVKPQRTKKIKHVASVPTSPEAECMDTCLGSSEKSKLKDNSPSFREKFVKALSPKTRRKRSSTSPGNKRKVSAPMPVSTSSPSESETSTPVQNKSFTYGDSTFFAETSNTNICVQQPVFGLAEEENESPDEIRELESSPGARRKIHYVQETNSDERDAGDTETKSEINLSGVTEDYTDDFAYQTQLALDQVRLGSEVKTTETETQNKNLKLHLAAPSATADLKTPESDFARTPDSDGFKSPGNEVFLSDIEFSDSCGRQSMASSYSSGSIPHMSKTWSVPSEIERSAESCDDLSVSSWDFSNTLGRSRHSADTLSDRTLTKQDENTSKDESKTHSNDSIERRTLNQTGSPIEKSPRKLSSATKLLETDLDLVSPPVEKDVELKSSQDSLRPSSRSSNASSSSRKSASSDTSKKSSSDIPTTRSMETSEESKTSSSNQKSSRSSSVSNKSGDSSRKSSVGSRKSSISSDLQEPQIRDNSMQSSIESEPEKLSVWTPVHERMAAFLPGSSSGQMADSGGSDDEKRRRSWSSDEALKRRSGSVESDAGSSKPVVQTERPQEQVLVVPVRKKSIVVRRKAPSPPSDQKENLPEAVPCSITPPQTETTPADLNPVSWTPTSTREETVVLRRREITPNIDKSRNNRQTSIVGESSAGDRDSNNGEMADGIYKAYAAKVITPSPEKESTESRWMKRQRKPDSTPDRISPPPFNLESPTSPSKTKDKSSMDDPKLPNVCDIRKKWDPESADKTSLGKDLSTMAENEEKTKPSIRDRIAKFSNSSDPGDEQLKYDDESKHQYFSDENNSNSARFRNPSGDELKPHYRSGSSSSDTSVRSVDPPTQLSVIKTIPKTIQVSQNRVQGRAESKRKDDRSPTDIEKKTAQAARQFLTKVIEIEEKSVDKKTEPTSSNGKSEEPVAPPRKGKSPRGLQRQNSVKALMSKFENKNVDSDSEQKYGSQMSSLSPAKKDGRLSPHSKEIVLQKSDQNETLQQRLPSPRGEERVVKPSMLRKQPGSHFAGTGHLEFALK